MIELARNNALEIGAWHSFPILLRNCYPVNVLAAIRQMPEVCSIYCATANPVGVNLAETPWERGILGVIDGSAPKGVEQEEDIAARKTMLRQFGYKL